MTSFKNVILSNLNRKQCSSPVNVKMNLLFIVWPRPWCDSYFFTLVISIIIIIIIIIIIFIFITIIYEREQYLYHNNDNIISM